MSKIAVSPSVNANVADIGLPSLATNSGIERGVLDMNICFETDADKLSGLSIETADAFTEGWLLVRCLYFDAV